jgi:hypothetical protein
MQIQRPEQKSLLIIIRVKSERIWSNQMLPRKSKRSTADKMKDNVRPTILNTVSGFPAK